MSDEQRDLLRSWAQVIVPVALAAAGQLSVTFSQINSLDKSIAVANQQLAIAIEDSKDSKQQIRLLTEKLSRVQFDSERTATLGARLDAFDARLIALKNHINIVEERITNKK